MSSEPPFSRIAIVGLGLIGGSIAFAVRKAWPSVHMVGIDRAAVLDEAMARRAIHAAGRDISAVAGADLVVLAAPVRQNVELLREVVAHAAPTAVITDVDDALLVVDEVADVVGVVFAEVLEETALVAMSKNQSKSGNRYKR